MDASFPVGPGNDDLPESYNTTLGSIKARIQTERFRMVLSAYEAMILLYRDIGKEILEHQQHEGWGQRLLTNFRLIYANFFPI